MTRRAQKGLLLAAAGLLFVLHQDLWLWDVRYRVLGLPAGLAWHVGLCLAAAGLMALLVRHDRSRGTDGR